MGSKLQAVPSRPVLQPGSGPGAVGTGWRDRVLLSLPGQESHIQEELQAEKQTSGWEDTKKTDILAVHR